MPTTTPPPIAHMDRVAYKGTSAEGFVLNHHAAADGTWMVGYDEGFSAYNNPDDLELVRPVVHGPHVEQALTWLLDTVNALDWEDDGVSLGLNGSAADHAEVLYDLLTKLRFTPPGMNDRNVRIDLAAHRALALYTSHNPEHGHITADNAEDDHFKLVDELIPGMCEQYYLDATDDEAAIIAVITHLTRPPQFPTA